MTSNIEKLGETPAGPHAYGEKSSSSALIELGTISSALALEPDQSPGPIPEGDYSICRTVSDKVMKKEKGCHWQRVYGGHPLSKLKAGDRVLIVWCGSEPVVIDLIAGEGEEEDE